MNGYPVEWCVVQTNLVNVIERRYELDVAVDWETIGYRYCQAIRKYVAAAVGCLIEFYEEREEGKEMSHE